MDLDGDVDGLVHGLVTVLSVIFLHGRDLDGDMVLEPAGVSLAIPDLVIIHIILVITRIILVDQDTIRNILLNITMIIIVILQDTIGNLGEEINV